MCSPTRLARTTILRILSWNEFEMAEELIVSDPKILGGKPCVGGTRLSVEFLLELAASGATHEQILAQYPQLTRDGLAASFRYAVEVLKGVHVWDLKTTA